METQEEGTQNQPNNTQIVTKARNHSLIDSKMDTSKKLLSSSSLSAEWLLLSAVSSFLISSTQIHYFAKIAHLPWLTHEVK